MKKEILLQELFKSINLDIIDIETDKHSPLHKDNLFPFEKKSNLTEYRVELGQVLDEKWLMNQHNIEEPTTEAYKKKFGGKWMNDFINDENKLGTLEHIQDYKLVFSVFLPATKDVMSPIFLNKIWSSAVNYLSLISNTYIDVVGNLKRSSINLLEPNGAIFENIDDFSSLLNEVGVKVNNDNLSPIEDINYRLYKDSKFFYELDSYCDSNDFDYFEFIKQAIKICK